MAEIAFGQPQTPSGAVFQLLAAAAGVDPKMVVRLEAHFAIEQEVRFIVELRSTEPVMAQAIDKCANTNFEKQLADLDKDLNGAQPRENRKHLDSVRKWIRHMHGELP